MSEQSVSKEPDAAWERWCEITDEAETSPDAPLEVVWKRLVVRDTKRTFDEVSDAEEATRA